MINHVRTLLLNLPGAGFIAGPGEEFIPPEYRPVPPPLPLPLQRARAALFGKDPDRRMRLYRVRQFLAVLHATPLAEFVTADDPRLTYLPLARGGFEMAGGTAVRHVVGWHPLYVGGTVPGDDGAGHATYAWEITKIGEGLLVIRRWPDPDPSGTIVPLDFVAGLATPVAIPGTALTLTVRQDTPGGAAWYVDHLAVPRDDIGVLAARLAQAGDDTLHYLFGSSPEEPWVTWRNLWESGQPLPYRLGAALLALARRTDEVRGR